eukprot:g16994.t1
MATNLQLAGMKTDFQRGTSPNKRQLKDLKEAEKAADAEDDFFEELQKKAKMPKSTSFSPASRNKIRDVVNMHAPAADALMIDTVAEIIEEKKSNDPVTGKIKKLSHYDAIVKGACAESMTSTQQLDLEHFSMLLRSDVGPSTIENAMEIPKTLTDQALLQTRITKSMEYVGKYQELQCVGTYTGAAKAVCAELHSKYCAKVLQQHFVHERQKLNHLGSGITLKWVGDWRAANEEFLKPFLFIDEDPENPGAMKTESMSDWLKRLLERHNELPITAYKDLTETLQEHDLGYEGLITSKCRTMSALRPACESAANKGRLVVVKDRMVMKTAKHADNCFGLINPKFMPTPSPLRDPNCKGADITPSPAPIAALSPIHPVGSSIRQTPVCEPAGEPSENRDADEPEEVDPEELVAATGQLICDIYVKHYLREYRLGFVKWARAETLKTLLDPADLEYEHKIGMQQIGAALTVLANDLKSFQYPSGEHWDAMFDLGIDDCVNRRTYAAQTCLFAGDCSLGLSLEANQIFNMEFESVPLNFETILRRVVTRMEQCESAALNPTEQGNQFEKLLQFEDWLVYASKIKVSEVLAYLPNENSDPHWKLKIIQRIAKGLVGMIAMMKKHFHDKKKAKEIEKDPDASKLVDEMDCWLGPQGPSSHDFVKSTCATVTAILAHAFNVIAREEKQWLVDRVMAKPPTGVMTIELLQNRTKLVSTNELTTLRFMNKPFFAELKENFEKFSSGSMAKDTAGVGSLGAGGRKVKRKLY